MKFKNLISLIGLFILVTSATFSIKTEVSELPVNKDITNDSFIKFLSYFEKRKLPYDIGLEDLDGYNDFKKNRTPTVKKVIKFQGQSPITNSEFIPETQLRRMSRMGLPELIPHARFYLDDKTIAVVYTSSSGFGDPLEKSYNMLVYDMNGNILPKKIKELEKRERTFMIARSSVEESITCRIDEKGRVWKNIYKNSWRNNLDESWINGNEIVGFEMKNTEVFSLDENGKFEQLKEIP